ncbi:hypothetical protein F0L74_27190 [Chitinophaga agrisoli]|uniref:Methylamine utilisation protein MauE domain-containing protein n=1 Tax=Chitinophaga agrisoli TaxID=2607653 RepID=A0A5B2VLZ5_9BACT|nr:MauE/DoxX family redox-associated membrane protein [Chitinophaga agrisoli]KAA2239874.1 hypothetical protein F0L74_27190 [Chitinophaga agrisoli]
MTTKRNEILLEITCYLLVLLFLYTGFSKLLTQEAFEFDLLSTQINQFLTPVLAVGVPVVELLVAGLLLITRFRRIGLYSAFVLMVVFTLYVGYILAFAGHKPCSCGGVIRTMSWRAHLVFNIVFTLIAFTGMVLHKRKYIVEETPLFI